MNKIVTGLVVILLVALGVWYFLNNKNTKIENTNPTPVQVQTPEIVIDLPKSNELISSPVMVSGKAKGTWYFEASAPVKVLDANGKVLGQSHIEATGNWMTVDYVPFTGNISFSTSTTALGSIVFMNDNPSGQASTSKQVILPVRFK